LYTAIIVWGGADATDSVDIDHDATPLLNARVVTGTAPSQNVTVPVGK